MTELKVFPESRPSTPEKHLTDSTAIARQLAAVGVRYEQWDAGRRLTRGAQQDEVIEAYREDIDRLMREKGYQAVDVVSMTPDHPDREALRRKFLDEHRHSEDEVRFFVHGQGLFSLHINDRVYEVLCEQGDLISVPANTRHWFDMGPEPEFIAIRLFSDPAGWQAHYTGESIAAHFSRLDNRAGRTV